MILVDTSIWIDYFNGIVSKETNILDIALIEEEFRPPIIYLDIGTPNLENLSK